MDRKDVALAAVVVVLMFLFLGDPDLFDVLRDAAMRAFSQPGA
jgi:hypothetical protein